MLFNYWSILVFGICATPYSRVIRAIDLIRSANVPALNLAYFKSYATEYLDYRRVTPPKNIIAPWYLAKDTTPEVLRQIFATNRKIKSLAIDCLNFYPARFQTPKPVHLTDKIWISRYKRNSRQTLFSKGIWTTWLDRGAESYSNILAVQLIYDLKQAVSKMWYFPCPYLGLSSCCFIQSYGWVILSWKSG